MLRFGKLFAGAMAIVILAGGRHASAAGVSSFESFYHPGMAAEWNAAVMSILAAGAALHLPEAGGLPLPLPAIAGQAESLRAAARVVSSSLPLDESACATRRSDEFRACLAVRDKARRQLVHSVLSVMRAYPPATDAVAAERESATLGILHFINRDYPAARQASARAYELGVQGGRLATVPAFVLAASAWHDERPAGAEAWERFRYAVAAEPANPLLPMVFAIYLDEFSRRSGDTAVSAAELDRVGALTASLGSDLHRTVVQRLLLVQYLAQMRAVRQSAPGTPLAGANTLDLVRRASSEHAALLSSAGSLAVKQPDLPQPLRQSLEEGHRQQAVLAQRVAALEKEITPPKSADGQPDRARAPTPAEAQLPAVTEKAEAPPAADRQPEGESGLSSIFSRVKNLFK